MSTRLRRFFALAAATVLCLTVGTYAAAAGVGDPLDTTTTSASTTTTTTTPSASSTTSTTEPGGTTTSSTNPNPVGGITQVTQSTTTTTAPTTTTSTTGDSTSTTLGSGDGGGADVPHELPPGAQDMINSVVRTPANSTVKLLAALQPLIDLGVPQEQAYQMGMGHFPVAGLANFSDDWLYPRFDGYFHFHHGTDVFAQGGTPVRSPTDGVLRQDNDNLGGTVVYVTQPDKTYFYMAHLSAWVAGQSSGLKVKTGDIIGYVGNSGDAAGGATHCHFEVHPGGGEAVDPKPFLDQWISDAMAAAPQLIASVRGAKVPGIAAPVAPSFRLPSSAAPAFAAPAVPARSQLLWASSANPQGGALQLAEAVATEAARSVDWRAETRHQQAQRSAWAVAVQQARAVEAPLTPAPLRPLLGALSP